MNMRKSLLRPALLLSKQTLRQATVRARLALVLTAILLAGIATGVASYFGNRHHISMLRESYADQKQEFVRQISDLKAARLHVFVVENTYWNDAIASFGSGPSTKASLDGPAQKAGASLVQVYSRDGDLAHTWHSATLAVAAPDSAVISSALKELARKRTLHWFTIAGSNVWEMHGAAINASRDPQDKGSISGYLIAGRPLTQSYVDDIGADAHCDLRMPVVTASKRKSTADDARSASSTADDLSTVAISVPLKNASGKTVAVLQGTAENPLAPTTALATLQAAIVFGLFSGSVLVLTFVALARWFNAPIRLLSNALANRDPERLQPLLDESSEFGFIALFISASFRQESEMLGSQEELEGRVADRTAELAHRASHDALTGLPNRSFFSERLEAALKKPHRPEMSLAVLFVDLDDFKIVNDSLGHEVGDGLLCAAAHRMQDCMPPDAVIARFGGDEFAILLDGTSETKMRADAERLAAVMRNPFLIAGHTLCTTASIGVASGCDETLAGNVLRNADIAMYDAKAQLRSRDRSYYSMFDRGMLRKAEERLELEAALRTAMRQGGGDFHLVYQPIYDIQTQNLSGMEALMRWEHPTRGIIPPSHFIPLAEETGLIHEMTEWVLREACRCHIMLLSSLPNVSRPAFVSVNFSAVVLQSEGMAAHILKNIRTLGLSPSHLAVEVTESVIARQSTTVLNVLSELRAAGVRVLMDDFGTGYSSLASLMDLPIDVIKIDRAFIGFLEERPATRSILRAIIALAAALQKGVICEGVERREQCDILAKMGCPYGQGYLFSRPLMRAELVEHLIAIHPMTVKPAVPAEKPVPIPPGELGYSAGIPPSTFATNTSSGSRETDPARRPEREARNEP